MKSCWSKDENGNDVLDDEQFWENLRELRVFVKGTVRNYVIAMEGPTEGAKTIEKLHL